METSSGLEAVMVPTGPSYRCAVQRASVGANYFLDCGFEGAGYVLVSGVFDHGRFKGSQSEAIKNLLVARGISSDDIVCESHSRNTRENARYAGELFLENSTSAVDISSDWWHARRMGMLFRRGIHQGNAPQNLEIALLTEGIDYAYSFPKSVLAYVKDFVIG